MGNQSSLLILELIDSETPYYFFENLFTNERLELIAKRQQSVRYNLENTILIQLPKDKIIFRDLYCHDLYEVSTLSYAFWEPP